MAIIIEKLKNFFNPLAVAVLIFGMGILFGLIVALFNDQEDIQKTRIDNMECAMEVQKLVTEFFIPYNKDEKSP